MEKQKKAKEVEKATVRITIEIILDHPSKEDNLAYKSYRYEIPMPLKRGPLRLQMISGEKELVFDTVWNAKTFCD